MEMDVETAYRVGQEAFGVAPGDTVRVLRKAGDCECGWGNGWLTDMDCHITGVYEVKDVDPDGVHLDNGYYFPWFVLEIIKKASDNSAVERIKLSFRRNDTDLAVDQLLAEVDARIAKAVKSK